MAFFENAFLDWGFNPNEYNMTGRLEYIKKQTRITISDEFEIKDLLNRISIIQREDAILKQNKINLENRMIEMDKEENLKREKEQLHIKEQYKLNSDKDPILCINLKEYLDSFLNNDTKLMVTNNIKKLEQMITNDDLKPSTDNELNKHIEKCINKNTKNFIYKSKVKKSIINYVKDIIIQLKKVNDEMLLDSKIKIKKSANEWAKQKCACELCGKEIIKANKSRHLIICKKKQVS